MPPQEPCLGAQEVLLRQSAQKTMVNPDTLVAPAPTDAIPAAPKAPTPAELFFFESNGYLVLENFLKPDHVARLQAALDRAILRRRKQLEADPSLARITQNNGKKSTRILYILDDDPAFLELLDWAPLMPYVKALINAKAHHCASDAIVDHGSDLMSRTGGWHIDGHQHGYRYLGYPIPLLQLKVGYYLSDMTRPGNANLAIVPGSHRAKCEPDPEDMKRRELFPGAIEVCAPAGSAILFHNAIWHTAAPLASPQHHRSMLYFAYEHDWMMGCEETWNYSQDFYKRLPARLHKFFHGLFFDPPERRQGWG